METAKKTTKEPATMSKIVAANTSTMDSPTTPTTTGAWRNEAMTMTMVMTIKEMRSILKHSRQMIAAWTSLAMSEFATRKAAPPQQMGSEE